MEANKWRIFVALLAASFLIYLDMTVVTVALPVFRTELGVGLSGLQAIISAYVLAMGIVTPLCGHWAERFGNKRTYLGGLLAFTVGSVICGFAPSFAVLLVGRLVQGLGAGVANPLVAAQLVRAFPKSEQGLAFGVFGLVVVIAPASGPLLGGWLVDTGHWRWAFLVNIPIGVIGLALAAIFLPRETEAKRPKLDIPGLCLTTIAMATMLTGSAHVAETRRVDAAAGAWFGVAFAALALFAVRAIRRPDAAALDFRFFGNRTFAVANTIGFISSIALFGSEFLLPFYLQGLRGWTGFDSGVVLLPIALGAGLCMPIAGKLYDSIGPRPVVAGGFLLLLVNTMSFAHLTTDTSKGVLITLTIIRGLAIGLTMQSTFVASMSTVSAEKTARATSMMSATRFLVQAVGVACLATLATWPLSSSTLEAQRAMFELGTSHSSSAVLCVSGAEVACQESLSGLSLAYYASFGLGLIGVLASLLLPGWPAPWVGRRAKPAAAEAPADLATSAAE